MVPWHRCTLTAALLVALVPCYLGPATAVNTREQLRSLEQAPAAHPDARNPGLKGAALSSAPPRFASVESRDKLLKHISRAEPAESSGDVTAKLAQTQALYAMESAAQASQAALKFHEAGAKTLGTQARAALEAGQKALAESGKAKVKAEGTFKVTPEQEEGIPIAPAPGQNDPPVKIRPMDEYMDEVEVTTDFIGGHSYQSDVKALLAEIDQSENKVKGLKLRIVEKENFIDSLIKREDLLQDDLRKDKIAVENLYAHIKALKARVERIKKEKQLSQLEAQFHQYSAAASKMEGQVEELQDVRSALQDKISSMQSLITPLRQKEDQNMRLSINADDEAQQPAQPPMPAMPMMPMPIPNPVPPPATGGEAAKPAGGEAAKAA